MDFEEFFTCFSKVYFFIEMQKRITHFSMDFHYYCLFLLVLL